MEEKDTTRMHGAAVITRPPFTDALATSTGTGAQPISARSILLERIGLNQLVPSFAPAATRHALSQFLLCNRTLQTQ
jgi:hypothetical protein